MKILDTLSAQFNPDINPTKRKLKMQQEFDGNIAHYFNVCGRERKKTHVLALLCPGYPHDGERFTYSLWRNVARNISNITNISA